MKIMRLEDIEDARDVHAMAFPADRWPDPVCTSWAMVDEGQLIGYVAAKVDQFGQCYIERIACKSHMGNVAPRLVRHAMRYFKRKFGCETVHTYIKLKNYSSIFLFKKLGFVFFEPVKKMQYAGPNVHYLWREI